jgi:hypothetical protein
LQLSWSGLLSRSNLSYIRIGRRFLGRAALAADRSWANRQNLAQLRPPLTRGLFISDRLRFKSVLSPPPQNCERPVNADGPFAFPTVKDLAAGSVTTSDRVPRSFPGIEDERRLFSVMN